MEFRLNKIDPEVRERVKEITNPGKIHTKTSILINKDTKKNKEDNEADFEEELKRHRKKEKKRFLVEAVKKDDVQISVFKEADSSSEDESRGHFLDVRK
ncbi:hypothetical protein JMF89_15035 [Clostridiaceae bacterium UIB06]|nr:hypothetical protein [Clostridiaceae bacterium UIB06]